MASTHTTPIPRPSRYYGWRQNQLSEHIRRERRDQQHIAPAAPPLVPAEPDLLPASIDKSQLPIAKPKRLRDRAHLKFVASQPCLVGIATMLFNDQHSLWSAGIAGATISVVWNYSVTSALTWRRS